LPENENDYYGTLWVSMKARITLQMNKSVTLTLSPDRRLSRRQCPIVCFLCVGRQRLQAVLDSTPEPVLVFDQKNRLLLIYPAVMQCRGWSPHPTGT
jgi:PAS domain-containing protein